jgi:glycosyltransferase involved in cell wall biosynthesis
VDLLRARLGQLLASPALRGRLGANGRARYEQEFTLPHFVARTLDVYRGVLADVRLPGRASADYAGTPTG